MTPEHSLTPGLVDDIRKSVFMALDPGVAGTGVAIFNPKWNSIQPEHTRVIHPGAKKFTWVKRCTRILDNLNTLLETNPMEYILLERPQYYAGHKGQTAAASDSLAKLCILYGRMFEVCRHHCGEVVGVPVPDWKGQLKKDQVQKRIFNVLNRSYVSHDADAVGIGLWVKGLINQ